MVDVGRALQGSEDAHDGDGGRPDPGRAKRGGQRADSPPRGGLPRSTGRGSGFKGWPPGPGLLTRALASSHLMMERPPRALLLGAAGLLLLLLPLSSSSSSDACGPCVPASCPALPRLGCPLGETRDACGCCPVCARGEGEPCGGGAAGGGHCAPGMECVKSRKRRRGKAGAAAGGPATLAVCVCKSRYPVCGSNGITYPSGCQLRAASLRAESRGEKAITQVSKGTCEQGSLIWDTQPAQRSHNPQVENRCFRDKHSREQGKDENIDQEMDLLELSKGFERDHTAMKLQECVRVAQGLQDSKLVHSPWEFSELRAPKGNFNGAFGS